MRRKALGMIIVVALILSGCSKVVAPEQTNSTTGIEEKTEVSTTRLEGKTEDSATGTIAQPSQIMSSPSNSSNNVTTYEDETHKKIQYGKLVIDFDYFHLVSDTLNNNSETFKCEINKGETWPETNMTITVQEIDKQNFLDTESIISYLSNMSPNYEDMRIYNNVTDDSGIISLYSVTGDGLTNYVVCYKDACYLVESDYSSLKIYLFNNDPRANYEIKKLKIECANSVITNVNETIIYNGDEFEKAKYDIIQGKDGTKYSAELSLDKDYEYRFSLKDEKGKELLALSTYSNFYDMVKFLDVNMDGYVDIRILEQSGTFNNSYALYVWDDSAKNFVKVKCEEMLSEFDVHDGYLLNQLKDSADSGVIQKLVWEGNTLVKESEENYQTENES